MPRRRRFAQAGYVFHVLNRGVGRSTLFHTDDDFHAFERILADALVRVPGVQLLAYPVQLITSQAR